MKEKTKDTIASISHKKKHYLELFKKYNNDGFAIKGSWAMKIMFNDFERTPNDIDLIMIDNNEKLDYRFNLFKSKGYIKDIKEKFDFFQWDYEGDRVEVTLTVSAFSTVLHPFESEDILIENPQSILGQKILSTIVFLYLKTMEERIQNNIDVLFLLGKYSVDDVTDEMIKHFIVDHYKLEQEKVIMYFVDGWKKQYDDLFDETTKETILLFLDRVKNIASDESIYSNIKEDEYFNYKQWKLKNDK